MHVCAHAARFGMHCLPPFANPGALFHLKHAGSELDVDKTFDAATAAEQQNVTNAPAPHAPPVIFKAPKTSSKKKVGRRSLTASS